MTTSDTAPKRPAALRVGAELELVFSDLLANGQGVGRADAVVVFCFGPLPHELARVRIKEVKRRYAVAEMIELLSRSPQRAQPFCPVFGICGGCQLQHLAYSAQLAWKRDAVRNALVRIGGFDGVEVRPTIGMAKPRAYRNKMSLVVDRRSAPPSLGFYRQRSHDVVPIEECPIVAPSLDATIGRLAALRSAPPVDRALRDARHVVARAAAAGQVLLTVTTDRRSGEVRRAAPLFLEQIPGLIGVTNSFGPASDNAILGSNSSDVLGSSHVDEEIGGLRYRISAGSFFQVNTEIVGRIFEFLDPHLAGGGTAVDLYCGVGTFALYFARRGWTVVGVEESKRAAAEAAGNARRNGLEGSATFVHGRVEDLAAAGELARWLREAQIVFLDPPRKGCEEATLQAIAGEHPRSLWYLSCDAATLARDLKFLAAKGYRLTTVQPFDMFPQTGHVETLVRLES